MVLKHLLLHIIAWLKVVSKSANSRFYHLRWKTLTSVFTSWSHCTLLAKQVHFKIFIVVLCALFSEIFDILTSLTSFSQCLVHIPLEFNFVGLTFQYELIFANSIESENLIAIQMQFILIKISKYIHLHKEMLDSVKWRGGGGRRGGKES